MSPTAAVEAPRPERAVLETAFRAMGCEGHALVAASGPRAERRLARVARWFEAWALCLSRFDPDSELSRLNARTGAPIVASPTLRAAMRASLTVASWSGGLVAPTLLAAMEAAGYDRTFEALAEVEPGARDQGEVGDTGAWRGITIDEPPSTIALPAGARVDLGGTAKGWAADRAAARLAGLGPALVDAGGDIAVSGPLPGGRPWTIAVADPHRPDETVGTLAVHRGGVATSGRDHRRWQRGAVWQHHIVDPRTGRPAVTDVLSATVLAPSALEAEGAAKVILVLGAASGLRWIDARPGFGALVVCEDGRVLVSEALAQRCDLA